MREAWLDGDARARLDTPAVIVDLDRVDANIERMVRRPSGCAGSLSALVSRWGRTRSKAPGRDS